jgi:predicted transcriptional regulator
MSKYGLTQIRVAELLGVTQTAISYYLSNKRGSGAQESIQADEIKQTVT